MKDPATLSLLLAVFLFFTGVWGLLARWNFLIMLMSVELMLNAVNLTLVTYSRLLGSLHGQVIVFLVITLAAAEAAIGLALLLSLFRRKPPVDTDRLDELSR